MIGPSGTADAHRASVAISGSGLDVQSSLEDGGVPEIEVLGGRQVRDHHPDLGWVNLEGCSVLDRLEVTVPRATSTHGRPGLRPGARQVQES